MSAQDIYLHLWSAKNDKELENIAYDFSISPLLRIWTLLKLRKNKEAKALFVEIIPAGSDAFDDMLYQELKLFFDFSHIRLPELRERLFVIVERFPFSIWAKIMLAGILGKGQYAYARDLYASVLEICPSNPYALAGYIRTSLYLRENDKALFFLIRLRRTVSSWTLALAEGYIGALFLQPTKLWPADGSLCGCQSGYCSY